MGIVLFLIPGGTKREFANAVHQKTEGGVDLVIIQKPKQRSAQERLMRLHRNASRSVATELWFGLLLRAHPRLKQALEYFRNHDIPISGDSYAPKTLEVESINSDEVYEALRQLSPDLLVVWGTALLQPRILRTAKRAVNLHLGFCPHYRGALANQHAVLDGDFGKVGATIHYINGHVDAGDILRITLTPFVPSPKEFFRALNTKAWHDYLDIVVRLWSGKEVPKTRQDISASKMMLLKEWTPSVRYKVAKRILEWEDKKMWHSS